jgi:hypothetical protein
MGVQGLHRPRPWAEYLLAILGGNIIYLLITPYMPVALQHQTFRLDWGLGLDFVLCVALYGLIRFVARSLRERK